MVFNRKKKAPEKRAKEVPKMTVTSWWDANVPGAQDVRVVWDAVTAGMDPVHKQLALGVTLFLLLFGNIGILYFFARLGKRKKKNMTIQYSENLILSPRVKAQAPAAKSAALTAPSSGTKAPASASATASAAAAGDSDMRGYKKTADGRTTTYFHRELSEADKLLLGDSSPKPISAAAAAGGSPSGGAAGSAWNAAGTWEEKTYSAWATGHLRELLTGASLPVPVGGSPRVSPSRDAVRVLQVTSVEGEASVASSRGKTKYIYDYTIGLDWKLQWGVLSVSGSATIRDVNAEGDFEIEVHRAVHDVR